MEKNESTILGIQFSILSPNEIRKGSVAEITSKDTYINNKAVVGGLFDQRMGIIEPGTLCSTDGRDYISTPGYFGHIELAKPVFYIQFLDTVVDIIQCICIKCSKLLIDKHKYRSLLSLPNDKRWKRIHHLCHKIKRCGENSEDGCGCKQPAKYKRDGFATIIAEWAKVDGDKSALLKITPELFIKVFRRMSDEDISFMGFSPIWSRPEWMICQVLAVPPPAVRPSVKHDASQRSEDDLTHILVQIIKANKTLQEKISHPDQAGSIDDYVTLLQYFTASMVNNKIPNAKPAAQRSGRVFKAIYDRLNGKHGRIRGNLMGKRVDYSARSVITPDPNLSIRELGIPLKIAQNITKPVVVNSRNIHSLTALVRNGPDVYPGAKILEKVVNSQSTHISLKYVDRSSILLREGDIVHRHMMDGDAILFNRQPTLHRMSMMGHIARIMYKGNTFRMNVGDTKPYNADFDGDEMNLHMPQTVESETELKHLAAVPYQIISPASNQSIIGIFQDSLLGAFQFTRQYNPFDPTKLLTFTPLEAMNLSIHLKHVNERVFAQSEISNFDLLSFILPPMTTKQKTKSFNDSEDAKTSNNIVEIVNGKYLRGQLDKGALSSTSKGLIHRIFNDYGNFQAADFIDNIQYIINEYMKTSAFSVGISDLLIGADTMAAITAKIQTKKEAVNHLIDDLHLLLFENDTGKTNMEEFETQVNTLLGDANNEAGKVGKAALSPTNRFVVMVQSGSKGSDINISQMISCLGQQQVEGKRIPYGYDDRTLPHFTKYDDTASARGFVEASFIGGLNPFELFFHAMGGRIGLIDTAVKTSTTGYIQRRLIKSMEDCISLYDGSVRNNKNKIIQFMYGDDNIDPTKIEAQSLPICDMKIEQIYNHYNMNVDELFTFTPDASHRYADQHDQCSVTCKFWIQFMIDARDKLVTNVFDHKNEYKVHLPVHFSAIISNIQHQFMLSGNTVGDITPQEVFDMLNHYYEQLESLGAYSPGPLFKIMYYLYLSPKDLIIIRHYTKNAVQVLLETIVLHYKQALIQPGEMVGIIAAQSIGEPTTQMTLNTFHFAGVASKSNVTRGVPRIEEILSLSANPKNPSITIYLKAIDESNKLRAQHIMTTVEHTCLLDIIKSSEICFDPTNTTKTDIGFINQYRRFTSLIEGTTELACDPPGSDSLWVIRLELDQEKMLNKKITMDDVNFAIKMSDYKDDVECIYSDYNDDSLIFRIRLTNVKFNKKNVFNEMDRIYKLKQFQDQLLNNVILRGIKNIQKVTIRTIKNYITKIDGNYESNDIWVLDTVGSNLLDVLGLDYIDSTRTYSNDLKETQRILGIEAARNCIYSELTEVIEFDGAYINDHHKSLLCDRMTSTNPMTSIFRHGINSDDIGPIAKASFEETPEQFLKAARHAELDNMHGVSANVMCGQEGYYGTSAFTLMLDLHKMKDAKIHIPTEVDYNGAITEDACSQSNIQIKNNLGRIANVKSGVDIDYMIPF